MKKVSKSLGILIVLLLCLGIISCAKKQVEQPSEVVPIEESKPVNLVHKVSFSGETLAMIANWYTGKSSNWKLIKEANPKIKPEKIALGQEIIIPGKLIVQRNHLTKKFVQESLAKRKTAPAITDTLAKEQQPPLQNTAEEIQKSPNNLEQQPAVEKPEQGIILEPSEVGTPGKETPAKDLQSDPSQKSDKPVNNDEEREKLLDELLAQ